jgi:S1-C subfamily serine protease
MASGILIHVVVGKEKRTEFFSDERVRIGKDDFCDIQIHTSRVKREGVWLEIERAGDSYRILNFDENVGLLLNGEKIKRYVLVKDGDSIALPQVEIKFTFFPVPNANASLISTKRDQHVVPFIEHAAIEAAGSPRRDDAKAFLREFTRELAREVSWSTKLIVLTLTVGFLSGILYLGFSVYSELKRSREQAEEQHQLIQRLEEQLSKTSSDITKLDQSNQQIIKTVSLAPNLRVEYGNGVCLITGVYDLVDKKSGKPLRYPDPMAYLPDPYDPPPISEEPAEPPPMRLTTEGSGSIVEYDFVGTGFHVGSGYILTNRHVVQPWAEDEQIKQMMRDANGRARLKKIVAYFPGFPQPFVIRVREASSKEDLAVVTIDPMAVSPDISVLPLEEASGSEAVGKAVVTMGYPSGPDRLVAMLDDAEAKGVYAKYGNSRQALIAFLAQSRRVSPLTTQGSITDLDQRRIVHDAKTSEGGSGAPLFGQSGKVIGVNFGVFTENTAANMAVPTKYAIEMLRRAGWKSNEEIEMEAKLAQEKAAGKSDQPVNETARTVMNEPKQ